MHERLIKNVLRGVFAAAVVGGLTLGGDAVYQESNASAIVSEQGYPHPSDEQLRKAKTCFDQSLPRGEAEKICAEAVVVFDQEARHQKALSDHHRQQATKFGIASALFLSSAAVVVFRKLT